MTMRRALLTAIALAATVGAAHAQPTAGTRFQVVDERGVPVRDAVVEVRPVGGGGAPARFPWRMAMARGSHSVIEMKAGSLAEGDLEPGDLLLLH